MNSTGFLMDTNKYTESGGKKECKMNTVFNDIFSASGRVEGKGKLQTNSILVLLVTMWAKQFWNNFRWYTELSKWVNMLRLSRLRVLTEEERIMEWRKVKRTLKRQIWIESTDVNSWLLKYILYMYVCVYPVMSDSFRPHGLQPARLLCPWNFSRQEYWSGLPFPTLGNLSHPRTESNSLVSCIGKQVRYH